MFCPNCGTKNEDGALFCGACGTRLEAAPAEPIPSPGEPVMPQSDPSDSPYQPANDPIPTPVPYPGPQIPMPKPPKKPIPKVLVAAIVELLVAIGIIAGIVNVLGKKFAPETVAKNYWEATVEHNWAEAYAYCQFPDNELLTAQMYVDANASNTEILQYNSMRVIDQSSMMQQQLGDLSELLGGSSSKIKDGGLTKNIVIEYLVKGNSQKDYSYLTLAKTGKKQLLFWDEWKVTSTDSWAHDITFRIPVNAQITFNGTQVKTAAENIENGRKEFTIPYLFVGDYQVEVTAEGMMPYRKLMHIDQYGSDYTNIDLVPSQETIESLSQQAGEDLMTIIEHAMNGSPFSEVESLFSQNGINEGYVMDDYAAFLEIRGDGRKSGITSLQISNVICTLDYVDSSYITLDITADKTMTYLYQGWSSVSTQQDDYSIHTYCTYELEDNSWKLSSMPISYGTLY